MIQIVELLTIIICLFLLGVGYFTIVKPYLTIKKIKKDFESNGHTVLLEPLNFSKDMITFTIKEDELNHKNGYYRFNTLYKNYDVLIKNCFFSPFVCVNSMDLLKQAYQQIQVLVQPQFVSKNFQRMYGGGLAMAKGKQWKSKRRMYSQIFNFNLLEQLHPIIQKTINKMIDSWQIDKEIDILQKLRELFFNVFVVAYFGRQFDSFSYKDENYQRCFLKNVEDLFHQSLSLRNILFGVNFLQKGYFNQDKKIQDRLQAIKIQTKSFMWKRYDEINKDSSKQSRNILSQLVFTEEFKNLTTQHKDNMIQDITADVFTFFFAGTDTTSGTLAATLHMLVKNPSIKQKLIKQMKDNIEEDSIKSLKNLKYMDLVFKQTLRLYGPANFISVRTLTNDKTYIGGVKLPKQTIVGIQSQSIHCSEKYYNDPLDFNPERWLGDNLQNSFSFLPFGGGTKNCLGRHLAKMQYKIALCKILKTYNFSTKQEFVMEATFSYVPKFNTFAFKKIVQKQKKEINK